MKKTKTKQKKEETQQQVKSKMLALKSTTQKFTLVLNGLNFSIEEIIRFYLKRLNLKEKKETSKATIILKVFKTALLTSLTFKGHCTK